MPQDQDDGFSPFASTFRRRSANLFPAYGEQESSGFDSSGMNQRAFGVQPFGSSYYPQQQQQQDNDYESDYSPSSTLKRYLGLLGGAPKREDYSLNKWGRILAALGGAAEGYQGGPVRGVQAAMGIRDIPFNRAREDYETEFAESAAALKAEQQEAQIKSLAGYRAGGLTEKAKDRIRKEAYDTARTDTAREKEKGLNIRFGEKIKVESADQAARDRHYQEMDRINDAWHKGQLSESEKNRALEGELGRERNRIMGISAQAATTRAEAAVTAAGAARDKVAKGDSNKPITPTAQAAADKLAHDVVRRNNPNWSKYFDKNGKLKPERSYIGLGPTVDSAEYQKARRAVDEAREKILRMPNFGVTPTSPNDDDEEIEDRPW